MKANELRPNNFVYGRKLYSEKHNVIVVSSINIVYCNGYEPIPITEEWLLKFGFKQDSDLKNSLCKYGIWFNKTNMEATYLSQKLMKINYVHQLQNLYFALTGEELTIKE